MKFADYVEAVFWFSVGFGLNVCCSCLAPCFVLAGLCGLVRPNKRERRQGIWFLLGVFAFWLLWIFFGGLRV